MPRTTLATSKASSTCFASNEAWLHESSTMASLMRQQETECFPQSLEPACAISLQPGRAHASFLPQTCARCNCFARNRCAVTSHRARAVTYCQGARNKPDFQGADRKRTFRQKMDGRAADRQLQGPDRQAGDQAAAGHLLRSA